MSALSEADRRDIGQHFVFGFHGHTASDDIKTLITDYFLGHVILFKRNVQSIAQVHAITTELQSLAKAAGHERPLMIGIDQENGLVSAFSIPNAGTSKRSPGAMALAASGSTDLATEVTTATAKELKAAGINWVYSPVADVNNDPRNPVIGVRSYSDDPTVASRFVKAVSEAHTAHKVAPSAKHFPGHGNTHVDSHLSLPRINVDKDSLASIELVPFNALVKIGIASIMTGHMALPLVTGDDTPCSLSRAITTDLLRGEMGYQGVVVTDCLEMEAVAETYGSEGGAVRALQAGADVVMICHTYKRHVGAIEAAYAAVASGALSMDELLASGARVAAMKDAFAGSWDDIFAPLRPSDVAALQDANATLSARAYAATIAHLPNSATFTPLSTAGSAVVFTPRMESLNRAVDDAESQLRDAAGRLRNTVGPSYSAFAQAVATRVSQVEHVVYAPGDELDAPLLEHIRGAGSVIFATRNGYDTGAWQTEYLRKVVAAVASTGGAGRMATVSTCAPYDLLALEKLEVPAIATFEFTVPALTAAAAALYGESVISGTVPVKV
ncbi:glycoside hydrolase [Epithele typhae]|uniref:glycoside hydrolase n=1 Tax=Epithele typhae TaxID=378194 RepID=UPI002007E542|nr:glycoside hydrolase [Epithele typhae]KAH9922325.1 glycoside hydrolase [Epithele typhae]